MNVDINFEGDDELKLLRDQVAKLLSRNLELQQRIAELEREKVQGPVETMMAAIVRSVQTAEQAITAETPSHPYVVSQLQATLRGLVNVQGENLVLSLPQAEQPVDPNLLTSMQIAVSQIPFSSAPDSALLLQEALEGAQVAFSTWNQEPGAAVAQDITARLTHLLATRQQWKGEDFLRSVQTLVDALTKFADALPQQIPPELLIVYRTKVQETLDLVQPMIQAHYATSDNLARLASALKQLTQSYTAISQSKPAG